MNTDTITRWLRSPAALPVESDIRALVADAPWFVPGRLMEAAQHHRARAFSPQSLTLIGLYGPEWVSAYRLLHAMPRQDSPAHKQSAPDKATTSAPVDVPPSEPASIPHAEAPLIQPPYTEDYFRHQGVSSSDGDTPAISQPERREEDPKTLMVVMSFAEWLSHFKIKSEREEEEERDKRALRSMWQQEKLAAALDDEPDEIPEDVFEMAVSSITREDDLASESLAEILEKQGKWGAAAEMYRKLGLRIPAKSAYFASRAEAAKKRAT